MAAAPQHQGPETALKSKVADVEHVMVYHHKGRFGGWPANHGIRAWGDEISVGFSAGYHNDLGPERHNIDQEKPEEHLLARSKDGGGRDIGHPRSVQRPDGRVVTICCFWDE